MKIVFWLSKNRVLVEVFLVILACAAFFIHRGGMESGADILRVTMMALAGFYFLSAFFMIEVKELYGVMAIKVVGIGSAVTVVGLFFAAMQLKGYAEMLLLGSSALTLAGLIVLVFWLKSRNNVYAHLVLRSIIIAVLGWWIVAPSLGAMSKQ